MTKLSNKAYDILKLAACLLLPLAELVTALSEIWGFQYGVEIAATIAAIHSFIGSVIIKSSKDYAADMAEHADDPEEGRG